LSDGTRSNQAEEHFSRLRRALILHLAGRSIAAGFLLSASLQAKELRKTPRWQ